MLMESVRGGDEGGDNVTGANAPLTAAQKKEKKRQQKKEKKYKSPTLRDRKDRVGVSHRNRDRTTRHLEHLSKLQSYKMVSHHFFCVFTGGDKSMNHFDPHCFYPRIFLSEPLMGSRLVGVPSVNPKPWRFTNNSLGLPHAPSLSVCLFL